MISVIVPVFNREKTIIHCIQSILNQTYRDIEIIVIDDGSTDTSLDICKKIENDNPNIRVFSKINGGVSSARSFGLEKARGDYIAFVDSDDEIIPTMLADMYQLLLTHNSDCCALMDYTIRHSDIQNDIISASLALKYLCLLEFPTSVWAYLISSDIVKNIKFKNDIHFFEDFCFIYEVLSNSNRVSLLKGNYYIYSPISDSVNKSGLNDKRLSCLSIIPDLLEGGSLYNRKLQKYYPFTIAHFICCNLIFLNNDNLESYGKLLQQKSLKHLPLIISSSVVPISYKLLILICAIKPKCVIYITTMLHR